MSEGVKPLKLANVGGVFVVLVGGCAFSIVLTFLEFMWKSRQTPVTDGVRGMKRLSKLSAIPIWLIDSTFDYLCLLKESRLHDIIHDLQFALQCRGNVKPVRKAKSTLSVGTGTGEEMGSTPYMDYRKESAESPAVSEKHIPNSIGHI